MTSENERILEDVASYYTDAVRRHGATAKGVDWNSQASQELRFDKLLSLINRSDSGFSVADIGCGYGALARYLTKDFVDFSYTGLDISEEMLKSAKELVADQRVSFHHGSVPESQHDYCLASGIFNVRLEHSNAQWQQYILDTIQMMDEKSRQGFAFNALTSYSDIDKQREDLYYSDPCELFDYCKTNCSRNVALLHDYDLYEFTIIVKKDA